MFNCLTDNLLQLNIMECVFCKTIRHDNILGEFCLLSKHRFHSNCLIYSNDIVQNRDRTKGLCGYEIENIELALKRAQNRSCTFCKRNGATVKCSESDCQTAFHLPCALDSTKTLHLSCNECRSYCLEHIPYKCIFDFEPITGINVSTRCCNQVYSHTECLKKHASEAKAQSKCPLCFNVENFRPYIEIDLKFPIPEGAAPYSLQEDIQYELQCAADICMSTHPYGRFYHMENSEFELVSCANCGSDAIHRICGQSEISQDDQWICDVCDIQVDEPMQPVDESIKKKRKSEDLAPNMMVVDSKNDSSSTPTGNRSKTSFGSSFKIIFLPRLKQKSIT